ncbi:MutS-related protein [Geoglobus acetivorans]|uniref:DNA mismatch repair proteins mutS family domain-containing protein n=1 Tax=Geoglobus acetivorans TaxID=565033 RepID=A0ABZ3H2D9_GEOAI|nr:endonuclease MutS2 [Geoglobus acetivorans]
MRLSGDAALIYRKTLDTLSKAVRFDEARRELQSYRPVSSLEEILERQNEIRKKMEISRKIHPDEIEKLRLLTIRKRFFEDRIFLASDDESYESAVKLGVCEVVRDGSQMVDFAITLNDFVNSVDLKSFAPELYVESVIENLESFRAFAEIEARISGNTHYKNLIPEIEELRSLYTRLGEIERIKSRAKELEVEINREIEERLAEIKVTLPASELLRIMSEGRLSAEIEEEIEKVISRYEKEFESIGIVESLFSRSFPVRVDDEGVERAISRIKERAALDYYLKCLRIAEKIDLEYINERVEFYRALSLYKLLDSSSFTMPEFGDGFAIVNGRNLFIEDPQPVSYCIGRNSLFPHSESIILLTGANSGGKTSLLDLMCQVAILAHSGLPVNAEKAEVPVYDEIFYFKRKKSSYGSGAFEKAVKSLVKAVSGNGRKLILIDEFEAITEPGAGAKILSTILKIAHEKGHHLVLVTHLGEEFRGLEFIRIDGIEAKGLDENFRLIVDRQPVFNRIGRSTPELIVERLMEKSRGEEKEILKRVLDEMGQ